MWDLPRLGIKPMSLALAGGLFTTEPSGKASLIFFYMSSFKTTFSLSSFTLIKRLFSSFFQQLLVIALFSSAVTYWTPSYLGGLSSGVISFYFSFCSWSSLSKNTGVVSHSLFQWTTFWQNSPLWPICLGWPCMAWLIAPLSYASLSTTTRLWSMKGWLCLIQHNSSLTFQMVFLCQLFTR